jgi:hypothetical protein
MKAPFSDALVPDPAAALAWCDAEPKTAATNPIRGVTIGFPR